MSVSNDMAQPGSIFSRDQQFLAMFAGTVSRPFFDLIPRLLLFHLHHAVACLGVGTGLCFLFVLVMQQLSGDR